MRVLNDQRLTPPKDIAADSTSEDIYRAALQVYHDHLLREGVDVQHERLVQWDNRVNAVLGNRYANPLAEVSKILFSSVAGSSLPADLDREMRALLPSPPPDVFVDVPIDLPKNPYDSLMEKLEPLFELFREKNLREVYELVQGIASPEVANHFPSVERDPDVEAAMDISRNVCHRMGEIAKLAKPPKSSEECPLNNLYDQTSLIADARELLYRVCDLKETLDFLIAKKDSRFKEQIQSEVDAILEEKGVLEESVSEAAAKFEEVINKKPEQIDAATLSMLGESGENAINALNASIVKHAKAADAQMRVLEAFMQRITYRLEDDRAFASKGVIPLSKRYKII